MLEPIASRMRRSAQATLATRGYALTRLGDDRSIDAGAALFRWLRGAARIGTLIDIGANDGAFLEFLQRHFDAERCLAFEPLPNAREALEARGIPNLTIFPQALSDSPGRTTFEVNAYGPASSMLPLSELQRAEFPQTAAVTGRIEVPLARLDDLVDAERLPGEIFVKMDVQGVEDKVISGGRRVIGQADWILVEVSFRPMYDDQALFEEVHAPLAALGFRLAGIKNQLSSAAGEPLFGHVLYRAQRHRDPRSASASLSG